MGSENAGNEENPLFNSELKCLELLMLQDIDICKASYLLYIPNAFLCDFTAASRYK
jgi:hypothetical protein